MWRSRVRVSSCRTTSIGAAKGVRNKKKFKGLTLKLKYIFKKG
jgi:hypothetical protein